MSMARLVVSAVLVEGRSKSEVYYNDQRPHRALSRRTPAEAYAARPQGNASARADH